MDQKYAQITYIVEYIENLTRTSKYIITVDCMTIGTSTLISCKIIQTCTITDISYNYVCLC